MNPQDTHGDSIARAKVYKALAECYYPPGETTLQCVSQLGLNLKTVCPAASEAADHMKTALQDLEGYAELAIDHARLFVGPFTLLAPPYGSVYLEGERRLMGDSTLAVSACYRELGLETAASFNGTPDHIAVELEFMHVLVIRELEALAKGDADLARYFRQKQIFFLERHLAAWVPVFTRGVVEQAQTRFYQDLAEATGLFVDCDLKCCRADSPDAFSARLSA